MKGKTKVARTGRMVSQRGSMKRFWTLQQYLLFNKVINGRKLRKKGEFRGWVVMGLWLIQWLESRDNEERLLGQE